MPSQNNGTVLLAGRRPVSAVSPPGESVPSSAIVVHPADWTHMRFWGVPRLQPTPPRRTVSVTVIGGMGCPPTTQSLALREPRG